MNVGHKKNTLNYKSIFIKIFLLYLFTINLSYSEGTKIGSITEIDGEVIAITEDGDERILDVYDEIYLKDEILIGESSSATIQFDDNTTIVMKELTSLNVSEFEKSEAKQKFQAKVGKGKIIIETGAIAKNANGEMLIDLSNMSLGIRGTRFNANVKPNGNSEVALAEDSFGNVGQIEISSEGQSTSLTSTDQVIEVTETREIAQREQSEEEKQEFKSVNETLVKVSKIDENELTQQLEEKLAKGNLQDANNDGVVDESDVEAAKEIIKEEKKQKIDFIVENSNDENTTFLSDVIDQSDDQNIGETIEKIIETKDTLVEGVVGNLSDKDNEFITTSTSEGAGLIKEKIFETIVAKETDKSAEVLSKVMAKSDEATINSVINNITEKNTNEESKLSLKVMADFSEKSPEKLQILSETNKDQIDKLAVSAVEKASTSNEDANLIAKVVSVASDELANKVVEEVSKNNTAEKQDLSAKVLKAIVETQPNKIEIINEEIKDVVIKQTVEAVKTQQETETNIALEDDLTDAVAAIIVSTDNNTASKLIEEVSNIETETNLSLKVMSGISDKDSNKINDLAEINKESIDKLAEKAVQSAQSTKEDTELIAKVVAVASDEIANKVVEEVSKNNTSEKQDLSAKVLKAIVESQPSKIDIINEEIKDIVIKQTVEAVKTQQETETNIAIEDDLTDVVAEIIVSTDNDTASKLIEEVSNVETETNLSLKVISGISEKSAEKFTELAETNKDQVEKLTISAIQKAENTTEDSQRIANVVAIANDELANKVVEEVSKTAVEEKKSLSIKVLKAIVDTEPEKIESINEEIKEDLIEQAIEATKDQKEGNLIEEEDLTDAVTEIIVKTDTETAAKVIEEINEIDTETNLSLEVISGISEKDSGKLNELSDNNKEQMDELTKDAVQKAENTSEDSELIAQVVSVVNNDLVNVMIEEVSKVSIEEKQTLSAKVLQKIVETEPDKMEVISQDVKDVMIKQTVESAKNQKEGTGIEEEENFTDIVSEIIVNTNTETASKVIDEINEIDTETNLSLEVISGISEKDSGKLNELSENNKEQMDELTIDAVQKAENTSEDSQLIANVVAVVNDDLVNKVVEEVSKTSTEEKQTLSAKVLKAIVDTEPSKIENINEETKTTIIKQTLEAAKNQEEGQITDEENLSDVVADIVVKTDVDTASKIIEEVNNTETDTSLSLKVMSGISEKDSSKINELAENNKENIDKLTEKAIQSATSTDEDSELIAKVVSVANEEIANKVVEEVSKTSTDEKKDLSAKVLKAIVDTEPSKIEIINEDIKEKVIEQAIDAAKDQQENLNEGQTLSTDEDLTNVVADIVTKADNDTAVKVLETLNEAAEETDSKLSLNVVENLTKKDNYEEKIEILSVTSSVVDESINKVMEKAVEEATSESDIEKVKNIVENSKGTLSNKLIDSANKNEESKKKITEVIVDIVQENPEKAVEILEKNETTNTVTETIKTKIEKQEAVTTEDFEEVFETLISPN